ncbi:hypothetical protein DERF_004638 [Dermatophagoides farinae]|uniref:Uncharacterized protein n=1 Tax=Dermatophagoides farinae TaxID=6954 RepID=A0A922I4B7_DERFA|nr:hypothetical protein DERF_004638 [Dermatophagoides farinae]
MQCRVIIQRYIESALNGAALSGRSYFQKLFYDFRHREAYCFKAILAITILGIII